MRPISEITEALEKLSLEVEEHLTAKEKKVELFISDPPEELEDEVESLENMRDSINIAIQQSPE